MLVDEAKRTEIYGHYQHGRGSIQDLARIYGVSVEDVLEITGNSEAATVYSQGDLIDAAEAGPGAEMNYGKEVRVPFSVD